MRIRIMCALLLALVTTGAGGQERTVSAFINGEVLLDACRQPNGSEGFGFCLGYILAATDSHTVWTSLGKMNMHFCDRENTSGGDLRRIVEKHLERNPDKLQHPASDLVLTAFAKEFPCEDE